MVDFQGVVDFGYGQVAFVVVDVGEVSADIVAEGEQHVVCSRVGFQRGHVGKRRDDAFFRLAARVEPYGVRDGAECEPESDAVGVG